MIHALQLRNRLVAFVDEHQRVMRQIIEQRGRRLARQASGEMARIILDAVAIADLADHLQVEHGALPQALRLDPLALLFEFAFPPVQLVLRCCAAPGRASPASSHSASSDRWAAAGKSASLGPSADRSAQRLDLIAPQLDAVGGVVVSRENFDYVAAHSKRPALEVALRCARTECRPAAR